MTWYPAEIATYTGLLLAYAGLLALAVRRRIRRDRCQRLLELALALAALWTLALGLRALNDVQVTGQWELLFAASTAVHFQW